MRLVAQGLQKRYQRRRLVVKSVDLEVEPGEIVGLLGTNGAGKTTTFYMLVGLVSPDGGSISLGDEDITRMPVHLRARRGLGYLPQEPSVFRKLTVEENIDVILELRGEPLHKRRNRVEELLGELGLDRIRQARGYTLSGGERRRVEIARALAADPVIMLLDEPFAGVDPISVMDIQSLVRDVRARGIGVLITDHNVRETLGICQRAYIMSEGSVIASGVPDVVVKHEKVRQVYLGKDFQY